MALTAAQVETLEARVLLTTRAVSLADPALYDLFGDTAAGSSVLTTTPGSSATSADGRFVAYLSDALNLVPGQVDADGLPIGALIGMNVFLFDRVEETTTFIAHGADQVSISGDGRLVAFTSAADDVVAGQNGSTANGSNVFLYDRLTATRTLVSHSFSSPTTEGDNQSSSPAISQDGRFVAFASRAENLVPGQFQGQGQARDIFLYEVATGSIKLVSHSIFSPNQEANSRSDTPVISEDGAFIAFFSLATDLIAGQTDSNNNIYLYNRETNGIVLVNRAAGTTTNAAGGSAMPSISLDGKFVAYVSTARNLVPGQTDATSSFDVFVFDATTHANTLVSRSAASATTTGNASSANVPPVISRDGRFIAYTSQASNLVTGQVDSQFPSDDVFVFDRSSATTKLVSHSAANPVAVGNNNSRAPTISADGRFVGFISSATDLVPGQVGGGTFLFDQTGLSTQKISGSASILEISGNGEFLAVTASASSVSTISDLNLRNDVFLYSAAGGDVTLASRRAANLPSRTAALGSELNVSREQSRMSDDGRSVLFRSNGPNLLPGFEDADGTGGDWFVFDSLVGKTTLVTRNSSSATTTANISPGGASISGNGRFVVYSSSATNIVPGQADTNGGRDIFLYDVLTSTTTLVSHSVAGTATTGNAGGFNDVVISADGRHVVYTSLATDLVDGQSDSPATSDVFLYDRITGTTKLVSHIAGAATTAGNSSSTTPSVSRNGQFVTFVSQATNLISGQVDTANTADVFVYDASTGTTTLVSHSAADFSTTGSRRSTQPTISADGRFIAFVSAAPNLVTGQSDASNTDDVFRYEVATGLTTLVSHSTAAQTTAAGTSTSGRGPAISANGSVIVFYSDADNLVPGQIDANSGNGDIFRYDAATGVNTLISHRMNGTSITGNDRSTDAAMSADGRFVVFTSEATDLLSGSSRSNIYLFDADLGTIGFVSSTLPPVDTPSAGTTGAEPLISYDGRLVAFQSSTFHLVGGDFNAVQDVFLYTNPANPNAAPLVTDQSFSIVDQAAAGSLVGIVVASDSDPTQTLSYSISAGNELGAFGIDPASGAITVASSAPIDYLVHPNFTLTIAVTDDASPPLSSFATVTIDVIVPPLPNLQVVSVTGPQDPYSGQPSIVTWSVTNSGTGATSAPAWHDRVYLSPDSLLDAEDVFVGEAPNPGFLDSGESYLNSLSVMLPPGIDGNYYFLVATDWGDFVFEHLQEDDNVGAGGPTHVTLTPPPDLQVTVVEAPADAASGEQATVSWSVANLGSGRTLKATWYDEIFLSIDTILDANDYSLGQALHSGVVNPNGSYQATKTVTLPVGVAGHFYFLVRADTLDDVFEHSLENNNVGQTSTVTSIALTPPPDLVVSLVDGPVQATSSRSLIFSYRVTNSGATPTPNRSWTDSFYLSADAMLQPATDLVLGTHSHFGALDVDAFYEGTGEFTLPDTLTGGYYLFAVTDSAEQVFELNRANNRGFDATPVAVTSEPANLVITGASVPATGKAGSNLRVQWTVHNKGTGDSAVTNWVDRIYASSDDALGGDVLLGTFTHTGRLDVGQSYARDELVTVPFTLSGLQHILIVTDDDDNVYEPAHDDDNVVGRSVTITLEAADLQVKSVTLPPAGTVIGGQSLSIHWTVENSGNTTTNANFWYDSVYLSLDAALSSDDVPLGSVRRTNQLGPGDIYVTSASFAVPDGLSGSLYVLVAADNTNTVVETPFEANNVRASATTLTVVPSPRPDLVVTGVDAPSTGFSGQTIMVGWNVRNNGANLESVVSGKTWYDSVYLSRDQVFDRTTDLFIGFQDVVDGSGAIPKLSSGATRSATGTFTIPRGQTGFFYVFVVADGANAVNEISESNNVGYDPTAVLVTLLPPVDLVANPISAPAGGKPGESVALHYSLTNTGVNPVLGSWGDTLYLSADDQWDIDDAVIGRVSHTGPVAAGATIGGSLTAPLPGLAAGDYHVILRSDTANLIRESNEGNNLSVSAGRVTIDVPQLTLGVPFADSLEQGLSAYYRVDVPAGQTLLVTVDGNHAAEENELFVRFGGPPTRTDTGDAGFPQFGPDRRAVISSTQPGTYYIKVNAAGFVAQRAFTIEAKLAEFTVLDANYGVGGTAGNRTIEINGLDFDRTVTVRLADAHGTSLAAASYVRVSQTKLFATFDLTQLSPGDYDVVFARGGATAVVSSGLRVVEAGRANVQTMVVLPPALRRPAHDPPARFEFDVFWSNDSLNDVIAPFIEVSASTSIALDPANLSTDGTPGGTDVFGFPRTFLFPTTIGFFAANSRGPAGLMPAQTGVRLRVYGYVDPNPAPITVTTEAVATDDEQPFPWDSIEDDLRPAGLNDDLWSQVFDRLRSDIGSTWGDVVEVISQIATNDPRPSEDRLSVNYLLRFAVETALSQITPSIVGRLVAPSFAVPFGGNTIQAMNVDSLEYFEAAINNDGSFVLPNVGSGSFRLKLAQGVLVGDALVVVGAGATEVVYHAVPGGTIHGHVRSATTGLPAAGATVTLSSLNVEGARGVELTRADANGDFAFESVVDGEYQLSANIPGVGRSTLAQVTVAGGFAQETSLVIEPIIEATIRVIDGQTGAPVHDVLLAVSSETDNGTLGTTRFSANGTIQINDVTAGHYTLQIIRAGYVPLEVQRTLTDGATLTIDLTATGTIVGTIDAGVLAGSVFTVRATEINTGAIATSIADSAGTFETADLAPGIYRVDILDSITFIPMASRVSTLEIAAGQMADAGNVTIGAVGLVAGLLLDAAGNPVESDLVYLQRGGVSVASTTTDHSGQFRFAVFDYGDFVIQGFGERRTYPERVVSVTQTTPIPSAVSISSGDRELSGVVVDPNGTPVPDATVELSAPGGIRSTTTTNDGHFAFASLIEGTYGIRAAAAGNRLFVGRFDDTVDDATPLQIPLTTVPHITGKVTNINGEAVSNALVLLTETTSRDEYDLVTDDLGIFQSDFLPPGTYHIAVRATAFVSRTISAISSETLAAGTLVVALAEIPTHVSGIVTDEAGAPAPDAVIVVRNSAHNVVATTIADQNGHFSLSSLPEGMLEFVAFGVGSETLTSISLECVAGTDSVLHLSIVPVALPLSTNSPAQGGSVGALSNPKQIQLSLFDIFSPFTDIVDLPSLPDSPPSGCDESHQSSYDKIVRLEKLVADYLDRIEVNRKALLWSAAEDYGFLIADGAKAAGDVAGLAVGFGRFAFMINDLVNVGWVKKAEVGFDIASPLNTIYEKWNEIDKLLVGDPNTDALESVAKGLADLTNLFGQQILAKAIAARATLNELNDLLKAASHLPVGEFGKNSDAAIRELLALDRAAKLAKFGAALQLVGTLVNYAFNIRDLFQNSTAAAKNLSTGLDRMEALINEYYRRADQLIDAIDRYDAMGPCNCDGDCGPNRDGPGDDGSGDGGGSIPKVGSYDPNDILGPSGFGDEHWLTASTILPYTIRFENHAEQATAPAQFVRVTQTLDSDLDLHTFQLGDFGFGDLVIDVPEHRSSYETRLDLRAKYGVYVEVSFAFDVTTGQGVWDLQAIDPLTGEQPVNPLVGFLPPNADGIEGQGFVSYIVRPKANGPTGTVIDAQARIIFDINEPIDTPAILNTLDAAGPSSSVAPLPAVTTTSDIPVAWSGSDDEGGSGVATFDIYAAIDGGSFVLWLDDTAATSSLYPGQTGHTYSFYSIATDNVGHVELPALSADAVTLVDSVPPTSSVTALPATSDSTSFTVNWSGNDGPGETGIAAYDLFVSDNGGQFTLFVDDTTDTSTTFTGQVGHTYAFYTIATDNVGHVEAAPAVADAVTTLVSPLTIQSLSTILPSRKTSLPFVDVTFSTPINISTLTAGDLTLTHDGGANLLAMPTLPWPLKVTLVAGSTSTYRINGLANYTGVNGSYQLTVNAAGVQDADGNFGFGAASASWVLDTVIPKIAYITPVSPNPHGTAVDAIDVTFSKSVNVSTLDAADLTLKFNGLVVPVPGSATLGFTLVAGTTYRISGLSPLTHAAGKYSLTVNAAGVNDAGGASGSGSKAVSWSQDFTPPTASSIGKITPNPRNVPLDALTLKFSEKVDHATFDVNDLSLTRNGNPVPLAGLAASLTPISTTTWQLAGLAGLTAEQGLYVFTVNAAGVQDIAGNAGVGSKTATWVLDTLAPSSLASFASSTATSLSLSLSLTGNDPVPGNGAAPAGIKSYDVYVSIDGAPEFTFWKSVNASKTSAVTKATYKAESNHTYAFYSVAHDAAGNVESKAATIEASIVVPDLSPPVTLVTEVDAATSVFIVSMQGTDVGNSGLASFTLYVSIDGGTAKKVETVLAGTPVGGVWTATAEFRAISDGSNHTYRFYSVGKDHGGKTELAPAAPADVIVTKSFAPQTVSSFDVNQGTSQRSRVRNLDLVFSRPDDVAAIVASVNDGVTGNEAVTLKRFSLTGAGFGALNQPATVSLVNKLSGVDSQIAIDLGAAGLTTDGYYELGVDLDGNGSYEKLLHFYRLQGDFDGDHEVEADDQALLAAAFSPSGPGSIFDLNGDGKIDAKDQTKLNGLVGHMLDAGLSVDD